MSRHPNTPEPTQRERDLAALAASSDTGWWDEHGQPAPFPNDFFDPDSDWRPSSDTPPALGDDQHPF